MKIDFNASFRDVSRLVGSSEKSAEGTKHLEAFTRLLSQISPTRPQVADNNNQTIAEPEKKGSSETVEKSAMASIQWPPPKLIEPGISKLETDELLQSETPLVRESVKSPTVLSVERKLSVSGTAPMSQQSTMNEVKQMVDAAGSIHGVDPLLGMAVIGAESSFNPKAVSSDGHFSKGLFQLLDNTGKELLADSGSTQEYDPFNPQQNVELGLRYLRRLHDSFGQETELSNGMRTFPAANFSSLEKLAVAAFNAGEGRVASAQLRATSIGADPGDYDQMSAYLPKSTQEYVQKVMQFKTDFSTQEVG